MRDAESILRDLRRISVDNHRCFGCGREHDCSLHGCAIIREAVDLICGLQGALSNSEEARSALGKRLAAAQKELQDTRMERDAILRDLRGCVDCCSVCKHEMKSLEDCDGECDDCSSPCPCQSCDKNASHFEWRGLQQMEEKPPVDDGTMHRDEYGSGEV